MPPRSMIYDSFESAVGRLLHAKIEKLKIDQALALASGSVMRTEDATATAQAYAEKVGYIRALNDLQGWLRDAEDEVIGVAPKPQPAINT
jgi:hypothetical protein